MLGAVVDPFVHADVELGREVLVHTERADAPRERVQPVDPEEVVRDAALGDQEAAEQHEEEHGHHHGRLRDGQVGGRCCEQEEEAGEPDLAQEEREEEHEEPPDVVDVATEPVRGRTRSFPALSWEPERWTSQRTRKDIWCHRADSSCALQAAG